MSAPAYWWNAAGLFLVLLCLFQMFLRFRGGSFVAALVAGIVCLVPFFGYPLRHWVGGLTPNISVPLVVLALVWIVRRAGGPSFFGAREWRAAWIFGGTTALVLYPSALGLGLRNFDSYSLGWPWLEWHSSLLLFGLLALSAALLVWRSNRFGWVLVLSVLACLFGLQESSNLWDYIVDPLYAVVALFSLLRAGAIRLRRGPDVHKQVLPE